jgi:hypothetical protein
MSRKMFFGEFVLAATRPRALVQIAAAVVVPALAVALDPQQPEGHQANQELEGLIKVPRDPLSEQTARRSR